MGRQIVHRLLISFPALLGVLFLCFCLLQVVPADPAMIIAGPDAKAETIAAIREELGLDRPIPVQFAEYIGRVLQGDLGRSIISNKMVSEELALTIGPTVELMLGGMLIPLDFYPGWLQAIARVLPFSSTTYGPARLFVTPSVDFFVNVMLLQILWITILAFLLAFAYRRGVAYLTVNGG